MKTFWLIRKCIGISGLNGLDKLLSFMIVYQMKIVIKTYKKEMDPASKRFIIDLFSDIKNISTTVEKYERVIATVKKRLVIIFSSLIVIITYIVVLLR